MTRREIPDFKDIDELARFWESHDTEDFAHPEIEDVEYRPRRVVMSVRFDAAEIVAIARAARRLGVDRSTLVRMVVRRQLMAARQASPPTRP